MKRFWLFRTNLRIYESYHSCKTLESFRENCWDFYLLMALWFLENNYFDEVTIWRLCSSSPSETIFEVNGKKFIQKFVSSFDSCFSFPPPDVSFFRGGFEEYDDLLKTNASFFGLKLYHGAGRRAVPKNDLYDLVLVESKSDIVNSKCIPFYKTASPTFFKPLSQTKEYDICFPCNFTQLKYKGQDFFIYALSKSKFLKSLRIVHVGNKPELGEQLSRMYGIRNIEFLGYKRRDELNQILSKSRFGLVCSNELDGSPRVITEILCSGTPLILREKTKCLDYYKETGGIVTFQDSKLDEVCKLAFSREETVRNLLLSNLEKLSLETICRMNIEAWQKKVREGCSHF